MCRFYILFSLVILIISNQNNVNSARILGVFPVPSSSHQVVFHALMTELANRGHEIVMITPNPGLSKGRLKVNITEIDTSSTYEKVKIKFSKATAKLGCVHRPEDMNPNDNIFTVLLDVLDDVFDNEEFKAILDDKTQKFDLIFSEALYTSPVILGKYYNAPVIWFSSFYGTSINFEVFGAPAVHPELYPRPFRTRYNNLSLWEKVYQTIFNFLLREQSLKAVEHEMKVIKKYFPNYSHISSNELWDSVDLVFLNVNPVFEFNRPVPSNVVYLGGLHLQPVKEVPLDLKTYLDNSTRGVVYFSLGTNVHFSTMDENLVETFIKAVETLPYDILWKTDKLDFPRIPSNARIDKWFPQRDLLHHPNVKAFITQGGLQSADEAIDGGVPVVALPMLADQWYNAELLEKLGVGLKLEVVTLQTDELVKAVKTIIEDESYSKNIQKLRSVVLDQPETPLERAVWWTEYVLRHQGAKHLRSSAANISWREYFMLDMVLVLLAALVTALTISIFVLRFALKTLFQVKNIEDKLKTN